MSTQQRPIVIGIAGGIASGKSALADAFERQGCVVSRSDRQTHELLVRDDIKRTLAEWFGSEILDEQGGISRKALGGIVFADDQARRQLEGLLHPILHEQRHELIRGARARGIAAVVIDAPLLFEAGVDAECDVIIFVDTPLEKRLQRVVEGRGWDQAELARRENAQIGLDVKRARADYVVENASDLSRLDRYVESLLRELLHDSSKDDRLKES